MKLLLLDENYPHNDNLLGDVFVHVRVKQYLKTHQVKVLSFFHSPQQLNYEGVDIEMFNNMKGILDAIKGFQPDKILIHFYQSWMLRNIIQKFDIPVIIWVHGHEALGWYRRLFNHRWYSPYMYRYAFRNTIQQFHFRQLIKYANHSDKVDFVFVSDWMRRITEADTVSRLKDFSLIPNPIAVHLFPYRNKDVDKRGKILLLRSFHSHKYANDISVKAILSLSKKDWFNQLSFKIIGDGSLFDKILAPIKELPNITIQRGIIRQKDIPAIHSEFGVFLCPTRQDAQGVSMCEAMSSGLVPVTSNNTAIPEFVEDRQTGLLTNSFVEVAEALEWLYFNPESFQSISKKASESIRENCHIDRITSLESNLIER